LEYTAGGSQHINVRGTYECVEITEDHVLLRCVTQDEVIARLSESRNFVAENLAKQLLTIVTEDEAVALILEIAH